MSTPSQATPAPRAPRRLLGPLSPGRERDLLAILREERTGGFLLIAGAVVALVWANSPWRDGYVALSDTVVGPAALHLDLSLATWATDGLLAVFFFVVGLELKREIVAGELRDRRTAVVPVVAALGGMIVPAALYLAVNAARDGGELTGWAVPTATDLAFAVAVLAVVGRSLPTSLRAFLLTLAVVDDLLGIVVIATVYTDQLHLQWLAAAVACVALFGAALRGRFASPLLLVPLALAAWWFMHASGVHATIAGVLLGLIAPAGAGTASGRNAPAGASMAERLEHAWRPASAVIAVPVFALFAAGISLDRPLIDGAIADPVAEGVALGLVVGKPLGILAATWLVARFTRATLAPDLHWRDIGAVGLLAGIGFTVSLLIGTLAFGEGSEHDANLTVAVLAGSVVAAVLGGTALALRDRSHRRTGDAERSPGTPRPL